MKPVVYNNLKQLTYRELLQAISNIKDAINSTDDNSINYDSEYYNALVDELDNRQRETCL